MYKKWLLGLSGMPEISHEEVEKAMKDHILTETSSIGTYERK